MRPAWNRLPEDEQLSLAHAALSRASALIFAQAETLATEFEHGRLTDRGGAEALRLLVGILRRAGSEPLHAAGHA